MIKNLIISLALASAPALTVQEQLVTSSGWVSIATNSFNNITKDCIIIYEQDNELKLVDYNGYYSSYFDEMSYNLANYYNNNITNSSRQFVGYLYNYYSSSYALVLSTEYDAVYTEAFYGASCSTLPTASQHYTFYSLHSTTYQLQDYYGYGYNSRYGVADESSIYWSENNYLQPFINTYVVRGENITLNCHILDFNNFNANIISIHKNNSYKLGFDSGYSNGITNGIVQGYDNGYSKGYDDAKNLYDTENFGVFSFVGQAFESVGSFLSFEIAPNITLGLLFSVPIVVGIIFVIFKFVKG